MTIDLPATILYHIGEGDYGPRLYRNRCGVVPGVRGLVHQSTPRLIDRELFLPVLTTRLIALFSEDAAWS